MEFHFVGNKSGGAATIIDVNTKPRFICFKEKPVARTYMKYLCEHKAKFGTWPSVDLSTPSIKIRIPEKHVEQDPRVYESLLEIKYKTMEDIDAMSIMTGISYFYCHAFEYDSLVSLAISGQEVDGHVDEFLYRERLDYSLKNI